jgi:AAA family ATP:ADP antiporter
LQVTAYVVTRPGRELLFTVISQDEKYKAKVEEKLLSY